MRIFVLMVAFLLSILFQYSIFAQDYTNLTIEERAKILCAGLKNPKKDCSLYKAKSRKRNVVKKHKKSKADIAKSLLFAGVQGAAPFLYGMKKDASSTKKSANKIDADEIDVRKKATAIMNYIHAKNTKGGKFDVTQSIKATKVKFDKDANLLINSSTYRNYRFATTKGTQSANIKRSINVGKDGNVKLNILSIGE